MDDFRVSTLFFTHPKTRRLQRELNLEGVFALLRLWSFCAHGRTDGDLTGLSNEEIALAAFWDDDPDEFVAALVRIRWLDGEPGAYRVHGWEEHNPYVAGHGGRSDKARKAANTRWGKDPEPKEEPGVMLKHARSNAQACSEQCSTDATALLSNAPSPDPSPDPDPDPDPTHNTSAAASDAQQQAQPAADCVVCVEDLDERFQAWGWGAVTGKSRDTLNALAPFTEEEITAAKVETDKVKAPNGGLFAHKLEAHRKTGRPATAPPAREPDAFERTVAAAAKDAGFGDVSHGLLEELRATGANTARIEAAMREVEAMPRVGEAGMWGELFMRLEGTQARAGPRRMEGKHANKNGIPMASVGELLRAKGVPAGR